MTRFRVLGQAVGGSPVRAAGLLVLLAGFAVAGYAVRVYQSRPAAAVPPSAVKAGFVDPFHADPEPVRPRKSPTAAPAPERDPWVGELVEGGWDEAAAREVCEVNREWWTRLGAIDPDLVDCQLGHLRRLKRADRLSPFLKRHPEAAGVLASVSDPVALAANLGGPDYTTLIGLFVQHAAPEDADELAEALPLHRSRMAELQRRGLAGGEVMFLYTRKADAARAYDDWLGGEIDRRLKGTDESLASFYSFVLDHGTALRGKLREDDEFAGRFPELWRRLVRLEESEGGALEHFAGEGGLWDTLALPDGERLLRMWGPAAIPLLFGDHAYPKELHPQVVGILKRGDAKAVEALYKFAKWESYRNLLRRKIPESVRVSCSQRLLKEGENALNELRKMDAMTDDGLGRHVGPPEEGAQTWIPFYDAYDVVQKLRDGRDTSTMDWVLAVAEPASFLVPGGKVAVTGLGGAGKGLSKAAAKRAAVAFEKRAAAQAAKVLSGRAAERVAGRTSRQTIHWGANNLLTGMQNEIRVLAHAADRRASIDVTRPLQYAFRRGGLDRRTFKHLSELEPRLFMRRDARVRVYLLRKDNLDRAMKLPELYEAVRAFFAATAEVDPVAPIEPRRPPRTKPKPERKLEPAPPVTPTTLWRQNVSAWWLMHGTNQFERLRAESPAPPPQPQGIRP